MISDDRIDYIAELSKQAVFPEVGNAACLIFRCGYFVFGVAYFFNLVHILIINIVKIQIAPESAEMR